MWAELINIATTFCQEYYIFEEQNLFKCHKIWENLAKNTVCKYINQGF